MAYRFPCQGCGQNKPPDGICQNPYCSESESVKDEDGRYYDSGEQFNPEYDAVLDEWEENLNSQAEDTLGPAWFLSNRPTDNDFGE